MLKILEHGWKQLQIRWKRLETDEMGWKWLEKTCHGRKKLAMALKWLDMAGNYWEVLAMTNYGWIGLKIAGQDLKGLELDENGWRKKNNGWK